MLTAFHPVVLRTRALLCAGERATPCLLAEHSGNDVVAIEWNADTGVRGRPRARWPMSSYAASALSPDGRTLAQVQRVLGRGELSLLDLETGQRLRIAVPGLDFPHWLSDGTLLAMGSSNGVRGIVRIRGAKAIELVAAVPADDEPLTVAEEFQVTHDGRTAAILMTDHVQTHWWAPRSSD